MNAALVPPGESWDTLLEQLPDNWIESEVLDVGFNFPGLWEAPYQPFQWLWFANCKMCYHFHADQLSRVCIRFISLKGGVYCTLFPEPSSHQWL